MDAIKDEMHLFFANKETIIEKRPLKEIKDEVLKKLTNNPNDIRSLTILEQILYQYELDYKQALEIIRKGLSLDSQNIDLRLDIVEILIYFERGNAKQQQSLLDQCFQIDKLYWRNYYVQGSFYTDQEDDVNQRSILIEGLKIDPSNSLIMSHLAQTYSEYEALRQVAQKMISEIDLKKYYNYELFRRMAYCQRFFSIESAEIYLKRALELNPKSLKTICNYSQLHRINKKDYTEAIKYCNEALSLFPDYSLALFNAARAYQSVDQQEQYVQYFLKCLPSKKYIDAFDYLAYYYFRQENEELSLYYIKKKIRIQKDKDDYSYSLYSILKSPQSEDQEEYEQKMHKLLELTASEYSQDLQNQLYFNEQLNFIYEEYQYNLQQQ